MKKYRQKKKKKKKKSYRQQKTSAEVFPTAEENSSMDMGRFLATG